MIPDRILDKAGEVDGLPHAWHERFDGRFKLVNDCWVFTGYVAPNGYGHVTYGGRVTTAHRCSWELATGLTLQSGCVVMHHCDNPPCIRPGHISAATPSENTRDMISKGRHGAATRPESVVRGPQHPWYGKGLSGEMNPAAKLTWEVVDELRELRAAGHTYGELMARFALPKSTVADVCRRKKWVAAPGRTAERARGEGR